MNNIIKINQTGRMHLHDSKTCDDAIYINETGTVICLADGVTNCKYGGVTARALVQNIGKFISNHKKKSFFETASVHEIRKQICIIIEQIIGDLCKKYNTTDKNEFSSTFLASIKTSENNITVLHAGDGCIFGQPNTSQNLTVNIISCPDNSASGSVYSAEHEEQKTRMRVFRLNPNDYRSILLCTDGFADPYFDQSSQAFDMNGIAKVFYISNDEQLEKLVLNNHIESFNVTDDISCVMCSLNKSSKPNISDYNEYKQKGFERYKNNISSTPTVNTPIIIEKRKAHKSSARVSKTSIAIILTIISIIACITMSAFFSAKVNTLNETSKAQEKKINKLISDFEVFSDKYSDSEEKTSKTEKVEEEQHTTESSTSYTNNTQGTTNESQNQEYQPNL